MNPSLLLVARKWPPAIGGLEAYSKELAETLAEHFRMRLLVLPGRRDGRPPSLPGQAWFLLKAALFCICAGRRFDCIVLTDPVLFPIAACCRLVRRRQCRVVAVHGLDLVYGKRRGFWPCVYRGYFALFRACRGLFCGIVANSSHTACLAKQAGLCNVRVINPALPGIGPAAAAAGAITLPVEFLRAPRRVLQFGRLVPRKGALWFAQHVLSGLPDDVEMFVAGPAPQPQYCAALQQCARVHYLGPVAPMVLAAMIQKADVVVMPNIPLPPSQADVEGFGLAAVEAAALGGVLLAARWQGLTDAVVDGVTGQLVEPGDPIAWRGALLQLLAESPTQIQRRRDLARSQVSTHFARRHACAAWLRLLLEPATADSHVSASRHDCSSRARHAHAAAGVVTRRPAHRSADGAQP